MDSVDSDEFVFVPLSGLVSVNSGSGQAQIPQNRVFVPLSGLVSVNADSGNRFSRETIKSFRPLIGVSFCKLS